MCHGWSWNQIKAPCPCSLNSHVTRGSPTAGRLCVYYFVVIFQDEWCRWCWWCHVCCGLMNQLMMMRWLSLWHHDVIEWTPFSRWTSRAGWSSSTVRASRATARRAPLLSWLCSPSPRPCSLQPSWRSGPGTWSSGPSTNWTSRPWPVTPSMYCWSCSHVFLCGAGCTDCLFWMFRGKIVLGYTEAELRVRGSGYQFIHAADMLYCAENHVRSKSSWCPPSAHAATPHFRLEGYWCKLRTDEMETRNNRSQNSQVKTRNSFCFSKLMRSLKKSVHLQLDVQSRTEAVVMWPSESEF